MIQLEEQEFFASHDRAICHAPTAALRKALIEELRTKNAPLWEDYQAAMHDTDCLRKFLRSSGRYPLTSSGRNNSYPVFAELFTASIRKNGRIGTVLPTGIATDETNKLFFSHISEGGLIVSLISFYEIRLFFKATDSRQPFCLLTMRASRDSTAKPALFSFSINQLADLGSPQRVFELTSDDFSLMNPNTRTCPVFRTRADAELTRRLYRTTPVLYNKAKKQNPWSMTLRQGLFNMTTDSSLFRTRDELERSGFRLVGNRFTNEQHSTYLPLYEAKMMNIYEHRFGTFEGLAARPVNTPLPSPSPEARRDLGYVTLPWYWVEEKLISSGWPEHLGSWAIGFRDITNATSERTTIACIIPRSGVGNNLPLLFIPAPYTGDAVLLLANLCSIPLDFVAKQKIPANHLNFFYLEQFPVIPPSAYTAEARAFIVPRVLELSVTSWEVYDVLVDVWRASVPDVRERIEDQFKHNRNDAGAFALTGTCPTGYPTLDCSVLPFVWDTERRAHLRAELDAYFALLYGLDDVDLRYMLDPEEVFGSEFPSETFRVLKENELKRYKEFRTRRLILDAWDQLKRGALA
jgi:hypothetical protein